MISVALSDAELKAHVTYNFNCRFETEAEGLLKVRDTYVRKWQCIGNGAR